LGRVIEPEQVTVLREKLADRDFPLLRSHRLGGGPALRFGRELCDAHDCRGIGDTARMSSLLQVCTGSLPAPLSATDPALTRRRPEQTTPSHARTPPLTP